MVQMAFGAEADVDSAAAEGTDADAEDALEDHASPANRYAAQALIAFLSVEGVSAWAMTTVVTVTAALAGSTQTQALDVRAGADTAIAVRLEENSYILLGASVALTGGQDLGQEFWEGCQIVATAAPSPTAVAA